MLFPARFLVNAEAVFSRGILAEDRLVLGMVMAARWARRWKEEFKNNKLSLVASKPELLLQPQWDIPPLLWLVYRCFMLIYTFSWLIYTALLFNTPKFLIFVSHISYCLLVIYHLLALCNLAWAFLEIRCSSRRRKTGVSAERERLISLPFVLSSALSLQWLLHSVTGCFSFAVSLLYWSVLHPSDQRSLTAFNIHIHIVNSLQTAVDLLLSSTPVHLTHFIHPVLASALYVIFALCYWLMGCTNLFGQPYIYSILDFSGRPLVAALSVLGVCLVCLPSCHFLLWNLQLLREWMESRETLRPMAVKTEVWWWVKVSGRSDFVPLLDPSTSVFESRRRTDADSQTPSLV